MERLLAILAMVLTLGGCLYSPPESYTTVGQAALRITGSDDNAAIARAEAIIQAKGLKPEPGTTISQVGGPHSHQWYEDTGGNYASIELSAQRCISVATYLRSDSKDSYAARSLWRDLVDSLSRDTSWAVERDQVCSGAP